jgi:hypothetical protein
MSDQKKVPRCYQCKLIVTFDNEHIGRNGKKIPLDPSTREPHHCPDDKNEWGQEEQEEEETQQTKLTAQRIVTKEEPTKESGPLSMLKIFHSTSVSNVEADYMAFVNRIKTQGGKVQGAQFQRSEDGTFAVALYYEMGQ